LVVNINTMLTTFYLEEVDGLHPAAAQGSGPLRKSSDMACQRGGQMILLVNGEMLRMENDVVTPDGSLVRTDGTVILPDGTLSLLAEDEAVVIDLALTRLAKS